MRPSIFCKIVLLFFLTTVFFPLSFFSTMQSAKAIEQVKAQDLETQTKKSAVSPLISSDLTKLPPRVLEMRAAILQAARSGNLEQMRQALEMNEILPVVSFGGETDPIAYWKGISNDGAGYDILSILAEIFSMPFAIVGAGTPEESYVWPYLAELPITQLKPAQQVDLYRLLPHDAIKLMQEKEQYLHYRAGIGKDGTWHYFVAGD